MPINEIINENLNYLAKITGKSKQQLIEEAVEAHVRRKFFQLAAEADEKLRKDPQAWHEYQREIQLWDTTLMDGLEDESFEGFFAD